jgi:hypothetical protein
MLEPLPPAPLEPHNVAQEIDDLEFHIERLEDILRANGLEHLIPERPCAIFDAMEAFLAASMPWHGSRWPEGVPEVHGPVEGFR